VLLAQDDTAFEKQSALFALAVSDIVMINLWVFFISPLASLSIRGTCSNWRQAYLKYIHTAGGVMTLDESMLQTGLF
jgi:hypothetical protein